MVAVEYDVRAVLKDAQQTPGSWKCNLVERWEFHGRTVNTQIDRPLANGVQLPADFVNRHFSPPIENFSDDFIIARNRTQRNERSSFLKHPLFEQLPAEEHDAHQDQADADHRRNEAAQPEDFIGPAVPDVLPE